MQVRPYRAGDRERVRRIAFETGYMGESPAWYWRDAPSFADAWTGYYTDREPESAFVAADGDAVVGYLVGCADTARAPKAADAIVRLMLRRQLLLRPGTAGFFWRSFWDVLRDGNVPSAELSDPRWPAHLHINLLPAARGHGAGRGLDRRVARPAAPARRARLPPRHAGREHERDPLLRERRLRALRRADPRARHAPPRRRPHARAD